MLGQDHAVDAGGLRSAQQRAEVLGILQRVQRQKQWRLLELLGAGQDVVDVDVMKPVGFGDDALMVVASVTVQALAIDEFDLDVAGVRCFDVVVQAVGRVGDDDAAYGAAGAERFADRIAAVQEVQR
jgi:hypothetical protein